MEDRQILALYFDRSEIAIRETDAKYGGYCFKIAFHILANHEDAEESVSDTWLSAWNCIPPNKPVRLQTFLGKLTRNISIDRWRRANTKKRGHDIVELALDELGECVSGISGLEDALMQKEVAESINRFLQALPENERAVFLCRYWYVNSVEEISRRMGFSTAKVKSMLHRTRRKLSRHLAQEGLQ